MNSHEPTTPNTKQELIVSLTITPDTTSQTIAGIASEIFDLLLKKKEAGQIADVIDVEPLPRGTTAVYVRGESD